MKYHKITNGHVCQTFEPKDGKLICTNQEFIAGDPVEWEDEDGNPVDISEICVENEVEETYEPFEMVAASGTDLEFQLYNNVTGSLEFDSCIEANSVEDAVQQFLKNMGYSIITLSVVDSNYEDFEKENDE